MHLFSYGKVPPTPATKKFPQKNQASKQNKTKNTSLTYKYIPQLSFKKHLNKYFWRTQRAPFTCIEPPL